MMIEYQIRITFTRILATVTLICAVVISLVLKETTIMLATIPSLSGLIAIDNWSGRNKKCA